MTSWTSGVNANYLLCGLRARVQEALTPRWSLGLEVAPGYMILLNEKRIEGSQPLYSGNGFVVNAQLGVEFIIPSSD